MLVAIRSDDYRCKPNENDLWPLAVDVGSGSGQSTFLLKNHFTNILGVDISEAQIDEASRRNECSNISFKVARAETIPVEDESVSLIIAAQCLHWFELPLFYKEVNRILIHGGVFAAFGYTVSPITTSNCEKSNALAAIVEEAYSDLGKMGYWKEPIIKHHRSKYADLPLPFKDTLRIGDIKCPVSYSGERFLNYIKSWASFNGLAKDSQEKAHKFVENIIDRMKKVLATDDVYSAQIDVTFEFFLCAFEYGVFGTHFGVFVLKG
uniref:Methyltransferase type 11 domain-containing protein n=1 Tax=Tetranychus urticae TaxID=32264 RepID=T1JQN9_TETUR